MRYLEKLCKWNHWSALHASLKLNTYVEVFSLES